MDIEEAKVILKEFNKDYEKENGIGDLAEGIAEMVVDWSDDEAIKTILSELDKKDKIIDKLITEITAVNSGRYEYMDNDRVLEIFTNKVEEDK